MTSGVACGLLPGGRMGGEWRVFAGRGGRWGGVVEQLQQILGPAWILCELTDRGPSVEPSVFASGKLLHLK